MTTTGKKINVHELVAFGKHLLKHLEAPIHPDDVDWEYALRQFGFNGQKSTPGLMFINWVVCDYYERDTLEVRYSLTGRKGEDKKARQVAFYIAMELYNYGPTEIAEFYLKDGEKPINHATVIHGRKTIIKDMQTSQQTRREIDDIIYKLTGYEYTDKRTWEGHSTTGVTEEVHEPQTAGESS